MSERSEFRRPSGRRQGPAADFRRAHGLLVLFGPRKEQPKTPFKPSIKQSTQSNAAEPTVTSQTYLPHETPSISYATLLLLPTYPDGRRIWRKSGGGAVRPETRAAVSERSEFRRPSGRRQGPAADFRRAHGLLVLFGPRKEQPQKLHEQKSILKQNILSLIHSNPIRSRTAGRIQKRESPLNDSEGTLG